ncbi:MAG: hypothetical protein Q9202_001415 [Teloschistes flavicans]
MENLSIQDPNAAAGGGGGGGPNHVAPPPPPAAGPTQLPPQARGGGAGTKTANLVLQDTIERIFIEDLYADIARGIFLVRGENVLLLGEIDLDRDDHIPPPFRKATAEEIHALTLRRNKHNQQKDKIRARRLQGLGFESEHSGEVLF